MKFIFRVCIQNRLIQTAVIVEYEKLNRFHEFGDIPLEHTK